MSAGPAFTASTPSFPTYAQLALRYEAPTLRGPFNLEARRRAGFPELELSDLPA